MWYTFRTQNRQPPQWCSSSPFIAQGGKTVYKRVLQNIPFPLMGIFPLILREVGRMGLNSHLYTNYYVPVSLSHVDVRAKAHLLYTLQILRCIATTIHFTFITIDKLQIQHVDVQRCTSRVCLLCSVFRLRMKIFTTPYKLFLNRHTRCSFPLFTNPSGCCM